MSEIKLEANQEYQITVSGKNLGMIDSLINREIKTIESQLQPWRELSASLSHVFAKCFRC